MKWQIRYFWPGNLVKRLTRTWWLPATYHTKSRWVQSASLSCISFGMMQQWEHQLLPADVRSCPTRSQLLKLTSQTDQRVAEGVLLHMPKIVYVEFDTSVEFKLATKCYQQAYGSFPNCWQTKRFKMWLKVNNFSQTSYLKRFLYTLVV